MSLKVEELMVEALATAIEDSGRRFDAAVNLLIRNHALDYFEGIRSEPQFRKKLKDFGVGNPDVDFIMCSLRQIKGKANGEESTVPGMRI